MIDKLILIIVFQLFLSYFAFKKFLSLRPIVLKEDEFSGFNRKEIVCGAGAVFVLIFLIFFLIHNIYPYFDFLIPNKILIFFLSFCVLSLISYQDDRKGLDPILRLIIQAVCVYFSLATVPHVVSFLPIKISILLAFIIWIYIINITNFVDGADGFCTVNCLLFFSAVIYICLYNDLFLFSLLISIIITPILFVFIFFNKPPAKLFMGDTGAIFLGFLIGYCVIELSYYGFYYLIFSAFSYPLLDCSITLFKKILKGYMPWKRLSDYYFLIPKKRKKKLDFLQIEKKLFYSIAVLSMINFLVIIFAINLNNQFLSLLCFITSYSLILIYSRFSN